MTAPTTPTTAAPPPEIPTPPETPIPTPASPGFATRVGLAVLCPRQAALRLCSGEKGGMRDAVLLLLPRILAGDEVQLTVSLVHLSDGGLAAGLDFVIDLLRAVMPDLIGIAAGGVLMSLLLGAQERRLRPGLTLDLAAQAWLLWLFLLVVAKLALTIAHTVPSPFVVQFARSVALAAVGLHWLNGFLVARAKIAALAPEQPTEKPTDQVADQPVNQAADQKTDSRGEPT